MSLVPSKKKNKKRKGGRKANLNAVVSKDLMSRAAFHSARHVFGSRSHWERGGRERSMGGGG